MFLRFTNNAGLGKVDRAYLALAKKNFLTGPEMKISFHQSLSEAIQAKGLLIFNLFSVIY